MKEQTQHTAVMQTLQGMQDDAVGSAAATLLHQLLLHLKADLIKSSGWSTTHSMTYELLSNCERASMQCKAWPTFSNDECHHVHDVMTHADTKMLPSVSHDHQKSACDVREIMWRK